MRLRMHTYRSASTHSIDARRLELDIAESIQRSTQTRIAGLEVTSMHLSRACMQSGTLGRPALKPCNCHALNNALYCHCNTARVTRPIALASSPLQCCVFWVDPAVPQLAA